ncbi:MAG: 3-dehydroquinate dehydratase [Flavobacteriales bacterium]|nr:3-dehydroquinate dehydratase [Flavobacteriales bacterium]
MRILIINGPNLDLLGTREPHIYGHRSFEDYLDELRAAFPKVVLDHRQTNEEGGIVSALRDMSAEVDAFILNAGGYSHTSVAIHDTIKAIDKPVVEVHISNIHAREPFRHHTITGAACAGIITGFGLEGYRMALDRLVRLV